MVTTSNIAVPSVLAGVDANRSSSQTTSDTNSTPENSSTGITAPNPTLNSPATIISLSLESQANTLQAQQDSGTRFTSLLQEAQSSIDEILQNAQQIDSLVEQAESTALTDQDRAAIQAEITQRLENIDTIVSNSKFKGIDLLSGDGESNLTLAANTETDSNATQVSISLPSLATEDTFGAIDVSSAANATASRDVVAEALSTIQSAAADVEGGIRQLQSSVANYAQTQSQANTLQQNGGLENETAFNTQQQAGNAAETLQITTQQALLDGLATTNTAVATAQPQVQIVEQAATSSFDFLQQPQPDITEIQDQQPPEETPSPDQTDNNNETDAAARRRELAAQLYAQINNSTNTTSNESERVDIQA